MTTSATRNVRESMTESTLFVAFELSEKTWKRGFTTGHGQKPRERSIPARDQERVLSEIAQAKGRFGLPETAPVVSCYEAGREGFWLHRFLLAQSLTNHVVDSSAIEVSRRQRRAKSDGLDVRKLLSMLIRYHQGERHVLQVVKVPAVEAEDHRHLHRGLAAGIRRGDLRTRPVQARRRVGAHHAHRRLGRDHHRQHAPDRADAAVEPELAEDDDTVEGGQR